MTAKRAGVLARQSRAKVKSINDQIEECLADAGEVGAEVIETYTDGVSASRYGTKVRHGYRRLVADIEAGRLDMVICWAPDRAGRELEAWAAFLNLCRRQGVVIRVTDHARTYDMSNRRDWRTLAEEGIDAADFSEKLSRTVLRGVQGAAKAGRPAMGPAPYGYRRTYDPGTGELTGQEPDPETAPIVVEIVEAVGRGVPLSEIIRDLNARGVQPPGARSHRTGSRQWYRERARQIALNPVYAGKRRHRATGRYAGAPAETFDATWPPLVTEAAHRAALQVLANPARISHGRTSSRPGKQTHLLTWLVECYQGHPLVAHGQYLRCRCVSIKEAPLDELVQAAIVEALATPEVYQRLRQASETTGADAQTAEDELARLTGELEDWRRSTWDGRGTTPATMAAVEAGLAPKIEAARRRADAVGLPEALRPFAEPGVDVEARWEASTLLAKRDVIRALARVVVRPSRVRGGKGTPVGERVDILPAGLTSLS